MGAPSGWPKQTFLLSEFLVRAGYRPPQLNSRQIVLHGHCHHKALVGMQDELSLLQATQAQVDDAGFRLLRHGRPVWLRKGQI